MDGWMDGWMDWWEGRDGWKIREERGDDCDHELSYCHSTSQSSSSLSNFLYSSVISAPVLMELAGSMDALLVIMKMNAILYTICTPSSTQRTRTC